MGFSLEGGLVFSAWNPPSPLNPFVLTLFPEGLLSVSLREGCLVLLLQPSCFVGSRVCTVRDPCFEFLLLQVLRILNLAIHHPFLFKSII